jgi:GNAT superfamily N-acetyltransferase
MEISDVNFYIEPFNGTIEELKGLFQTEYSDETPICNESFLQWQYFENPCGEAVIICARDKFSNALVAVYIVNPVEINFGIEKRKGALSLNTFTRKDFRGKGLFPIMAKACYESAKQKGAQFIIGFPNQSSYSGFIKKLGFSDLGNVNYMFKPINVGGILTQKLFKITKQITKPSLFSSKFNKGVEIREINIADLADKESLTIFFDSIKREGTIHTNRSIEYLKWRYINNPLHLYKLIGAFDGSELKAFAVINIKQNRWMRDGFIVDLCIPEENKKSNRATAKFFVGIIIKYFRSNNVHFIKVYSNINSYEYKFLKASHFLSKSKFNKSINIPFIYKQLDNNHNKPPLIDHWDIVMGDTDIV